ncbi:MAG: hypothetical protein ACKOAD_07560 [Gammaproteobacteria bacterium]
MLKRLPKILARIWASLGFLLGLICFVLLPLQACVPHLGQKNAMPCMPKPLKISQMPIFNLEPKIHLNTKLYGEKKIYLDPGMIVFGRDFLGHLGQALEAKGWRLAQSSKDAHWIIQARLKSRDSAKSTDVWAMNLEIWEKIASSSTTQEKISRAKTAKPLPEGMKRLLVTDKSEWLCYSSQLTLSGKQSSFEPALLQYFIELF